MCRFCDAASSTCPAECARALQWLALIEHPNALPSEADLRLAGNCSSGPSSHYLALHAKPLPRLRDTRTLRRQHDADRPDFARFARAMRTRSEDMTSW